MSDGLSTETHDDCLDINEPYIYDESIQSLQYFEFTPQTSQIVTQLGIRSRFTSTLKMFTLYLQKVISIYRGNYVVMTTTIHTQQQMKLL